MKCIIAQKRMRMVVMLGEQQEQWDAIVLPKTRYLYDRTKQGYSIKGVHSVRYFGTYLTFWRIANKSFDGTFQCMKVPTIKINEEQIPRLRHTLHAETSEPCGIIQQHRIVNCNNIAATVSSFLMRTNWGRGTPCFIFWLSRGFGESWSSWTQLS